MTSKTLAVALLAAALSSPSLAHAQDSGPYKVQKIQLVDGDGGFDYVTADPDGRNLYVARSGPAGHIGVFNLDTLAPVGDIPGTSSHGGAVDTQTGHGFATSSPVTMFDAKTFAIIKKIDTRVALTATSTTPSTTTSTFSAMLLPTSRSSTIKTAPFSAPSTSEARPNRPPPMDAAKSMSTSKTRPPSPSSTPTP